MVVSVSAMVTLGVGLRRGLGQGLGLGLELGELAPTDKLRVMARATHVYVVYYLYLI